jgi:hypothetical protein
MRKRKKKRHTPLVFPDSLTPEQLQILQEKRFLFDILVPLDQRPKLAYLIECFTCHQKTTFEVDGRKLLTENQLHLERILKGWTIAGRGYECPACLDRWAKAVVAFIHRHDRPLVEEQIIAESIPEEKPLEKGSSEDA